MKWLNKIFGNESEEVINKKLDFILTTLLAIVALLVLVTPSVNVEDNRVISEITEVIHVPAPSSGINIEDRNCVIADYGNDKFLLCEMEGSNGRIWEESSVLP